LLSIPLILLNTTSTARGKRPLSSVASDLPPEMVYVLPELLTPYAKSRPFSPWRSFSTRGRVVVVKKDAWGVEGGKTRSNE
jgi:hypothetical protein